MRTVFETAQALQNKIENDTLYPLRQKEAIRQTFLADDRMPAEMTQNRLDTLNNRFDITDRQNTWESALGANAATSEEARLRAQNDLSTFGDRTNLENLNRQNETLQAQSDVNTFGHRQALEANKRQAEDARLKVQREKDKFTLDNLDISKEAWRTEIDADIASDKQRIHESESMIETKMYDTEFNAIMENLPDYESLMDLQKIDVLVQGSKGKHTKVKARVKMKLREDIAPDYLEAIRLTQESLIEGQAVSDLDAPTQSQMLKADRLKRQAQSKLRSLDMQVLDQLIAQGVIKNSELPAEVEQVIEMLRDQSFTGGAPLPVTATGEVIPEANPAVPTDAAPAAAAPDAPAPVPSAQAPAPIDTQTPDETLSQTGSVQSIIDDLSAKYSNDVNLVRIAAKTLGETMTRDPADAVEAQTFIDSIANSVQEAMGKGDKTDNKKGLNPTYKTIIFEMAGERILALEAQFGINTEVK